MQPAGLAERALRHFQEELLAAAREVRSSAQDETQGGDR